MAIRKSFTESEDRAQSRRVDQAALGERYRLRGRFRRRSGAPVLLAVDEALGRLVAIKTSADRAAARAEADILDALDHPAIVRLHERLEVEGGLWLVLDYVGGDSVETRLQTAGTMPPDVVADLLRQLALALRHMHERGFLHRDLKPANVIVRPEGEVVIIDLGAAAPIVGAPASGTSELSHGYAAPEQYLADAAEGPWTDIYALGAFGYRALTGDAPPAALDRVDRGAPLQIPVHDEAPALSTALEAALQVDAAARPQSAEAFLALLGSDPAPPPPVDDKGEGVPTVRIRRRRRSHKALPDEPSAGELPRRRRRLVPLLLLAGLGLIVLGALGAYAGWPLYERHIKTTWTVDAAGGGDVVSIGEALERAGDGARIVVRLGTYEESLVLDRAAHLVAADGADERPVIAPPSGPCLLTTASGGSLSGLALQGSETAGVACLAISGGDFRVEDSSISASAGPSLEVRAGAAPEIRGSEIRGAGAVIREGAQPLLRDVTFDAIEGPSVVIRSGALPELIGNRINRSGPVVFAEGATGLLEDNEIREARSNAIEVASGANASVKANEITAPGESAVFVYGNADGRIEANRIVGSTLSAIIVAEGASARLAENEVLGSGEHGILLLDGAEAVIENNLIEGSKGHGVAIAPAAEAQLGGNNFAGNRSGAILDARSSSGPGSDAGGS